MNKYCAFTICSKNYLAQAFTLRESFIKYNADKDFYIFLADTCNSELLEKYDCIIPLDEAIIPKWENMAFKYDVIEFNTSIKPFCLNYLLTKYERIIYLDPDIFVVDSLDVVYEMLNKKDFVITPHYNHIEDKFSGAVPEEEILFVGIYNLGFCAIKRSEVSNKIVSWWMNRLESKCYADKNDALHVDQRWIDFLPAAFPNNIYICQHPGVNMAIWNLHERGLKNNCSPYLVEDYVTREIFPLIFFHFSGFDPFNKQVLNRRHPKFNILDFPNFTNIINIYSELVYKNGYEFYSKELYGFNQFEDGTRILPINRRYYYKTMEHTITTKLFKIDGDLYSLFKRKKMLSKVKNSKDAILKVSENEKRKKYKILNRFMFVVFKILGCDKYNAFLRALNRISLMNYQNEIL